MSRRPVAAVRTVGDGPPNWRHGATQGPLQAQLFRLAHLLGEAAEVVRDLARDHLAGSPNPRLMEGVAPLHEGRLLTVGDLAKVLQVDPKTVRRWREAGKLPPAVELGGVVRWRPEDVDAWIRDQGGKS